jgi:hypothetical protein
MYYTTGHMSESRDLLSAACDQKHENWLHCLKYKEVSVYDHLVYYLRPAAGAINSHSMYRLQTYTDKH